jgi:restriction system protein
MNIDSYEYQYPPELFQLLTDAISLLSKSKPSVLALFWSAGVDKADTNDLEKQVIENRSSISKREIAQTVLTRLCDKKGAGLGPRRAVLQRVVEWEDFSTCWDKDRPQAELLVAKIQKYVGRKDTVTRIFQAGEEQRNLRAEESRKQLLEKQQRKRELSEVKADISSLYSLSNAPKRGKMLESVLNRLFRVSDMLVSEAFSLTGFHGEGIVEQIDGAVEIDGGLYLVEMKWLNEPVDIEAVSRHISRLYGRAVANGIFIAEPGYTKAAVAECRGALREKLIILCELQEIVFLLEQERPLKELLKAKIRAAVLYKNPLYYALSSS